MLVAIRFSGSFVAEDDAGIARGTWRARSRLWSTDCCIVLFGYNLALLSWTVAASVENDPTRDVWTLSPVDVFGVDHAAHVKASKTQLIAHEIV